MSSVTAGLAPEHVVELRTLLAAELSPDARHAVYSVSAPSADRSADGAQLGLVEIASGETRELTDAGSLDTAPTWSPGGDAVLFRSVRSGVPQLHRVDVASGEIAVLSEQASGVGPMPHRISPDGRQVVFAGPAAPPRDPAAPYRVTSALWRLDGVGLLRDAVMELFALPIEGGPARQLTDAGRIPLSAAWSPDGGALLCLSLGEGDAPTFALDVHDLGAGTSERVWECAFAGMPPAAAWLPDGRLVRTTANRVLGYGEPLDVVVADAAPDAAEDVRSAGLEGWIFGTLQADFPYDAFQAPRLVLAPDGATAFVAVQAGGRIETWALPLTGEAAPRRVHGGDRASIPFDASAELLLVGSSTLHEPVDLWAMRHDGGDARRLTHLNGDRYAPERHFTVHPLEVAGSDGEPVEAWFLAPRGREGAVPTVLTNHGGPHAAWGHIFSFDFALLGAAGYGTLLVNQRGSTGYAPAFAGQLHGDWGNHDVADLERALDAAIEAGLADPAALAVRGVSAGAYLAGWQITHGTRFRAAVLESPALDWNAMLGADAGFVFQRWMSGGALGREASYGDRGDVSPVAHAPRCTTPTLIVQHEQDLRTPPANADLFFALLKLAGCEVEMLRMPLTSHAGSLQLGDPRTRVAENEALLDWLARHLGADPS